MLTKYIKEILQQEKQRGVNNLYLRSIAKEYLQTVILNFIYSKDQYKSQFIFTGGTCLRHFYGLERLSEDLDFDLLSKINKEQLVKDIQVYFDTTLLYKNLQISIKQQGNQILLKFPILKELELASTNDSDLLYIKLDLSQVKGKYYNLEKTAKSVHGYNFVALHYDLPSLFAGKLNAILTRNLLVGKEDNPTIKGRDFYDLLWYLKSTTVVNLKFLQEKLDNKTLDITKLNNLITDKVELACTEYKTDFKNDLIPFISNPEFINDYVENYLDEFKRYKIAN